jgi:kumamolisin
MPSKKVVLKGSERTPLGKRVGDVQKNETIDVSVVLKPKTRPAVPTAGGATMSREQFAQQHGADPAVIDKVKAFAEAEGLKVIEVSQERRLVKLEGTVDQFAKAFGAQLDKYQHEGIEYRARTGALQIPEDLTDSIEAVMGLDNRPQAKPHYRVHGVADEKAALGVAPRAGGISYTPPQVAALYKFPKDVNGSGQTIGILELGGGFHPKDLTNYFASIGVKEPTVTSVSVDKGKNHPTTPSSADGEVLLDIEVAGAVAPGAKIVVYFAPNTDQGFLDALTTAVHDKTNKPSVVSISWGAPESQWTSQAMTAFDSAAQDAAALGVSICAASGDNGSSDGVSDGKNHVDFPASSPHILACGGTTLNSSGGAITSETVWNDGAGGGAGGGGFSTQFTPLPTYQSSAGVKGSGRGVPDVSGDADPQTGYQVLVDGQSMVIGGTSAVAPLWSGLIALMNQKLGKPVGFLQPAIYALASSTKAFQDITSGNNGSFSAAPGWDAATGLGSPNGQNLVTALAATATKAQTMVT